MSVQLASVKPDIDLSKLPEVTETYEVQWTIPEWSMVRKHHILVKSQKIIFETGVGSSFPHGCRSKWAVGLNVKSSVHGGPDKAGVQWNLMDFEEASADQIFEVTVKNQLVGQTGEFCYTEELNEDRMYEGQIFNGIHFVEAHGKQRRTHGHVADYIQEDDSVKYQLTLILKSRLKDKDYVDYKVDQFLKTSKKQMCENQASFLNRRDVNNSDFKIVTGDDKEIFVHGTILKAQCPAFAKMLNRDRSKTDTGVVKVDDVSAFTMNILLHYFYTGELLPAWRENENIYEFTNAAGKYEITQILELLDDVLGRSIPQGEATHVDVQLLNLASELSMRNAEEKLLKRIVDKINNVKGSQEIFELFGYHKHEVLKMAGFLGGKIFEDTKVLKILDDLIGNKEGNKKEFEERGLHLLAVVQVKNGGLKNLENSLLKRFWRSASKISSADQLFAVFGHGKRKR